jgi:hypothetical protein
MGSTPAFVLLKAESCVVIAAPLYAASLECRMRTSKVIFLGGRGFHYRPSSAARPPKKRREATKWPRARASSGGKKNRLLEPPPAVGARAGCWSHRLLTSTAGAGARRLSSNKARGCCCRTSCRPRHHRAPCIAVEACSPAVFAHTWCIATAAGAACDAAARAAGGSASAAKSNVSTTAWPVFMPLNCLSSSNLVSAGSADAHLAVV